MILGQLFGYTYMYTALFCIHSSLCKIDVSVEGQEGVIVQMRTNESSSDFNKCEFRQCL